MSRQYYIAEYIKDGEVYNLRLTSPELVSLKTKLLAEDIELKAHQVDRQIYLQYPVKPIVWDVVTEGSN